MLSSELGLIWLPYATDWFNGHSRRIANLYLSDSGVTGVGHIVDRVDSLLRPFTGEGIWEFFERAGNYGVPFALLYLAGWPRLLKSWFSLAAPLLDSAKAVRLAWVLRVTVFGLLLGHGGFGAFMLKHTWTHYLATLRIVPDDISTLSFLPIIGWFEIALSLLVLVLPSAELLLFVFAWKVFTEMLRPLSGEPLWEFIERFGSYSAPLALFFLLLLQGCD